MNFTPAMNDGAHVFVFGSNEGGKHHGGAAREAFNNWGASFGTGLGMSGQSYAIPTMNREFEPLSLNSIAHYVNQFKEFAAGKPNLIFLVTAIGTGICGYKESEISPMFQGAPDNCVLPDNWRK